MKHVNKYPQLGFGLGVRPEHFDEILNGQSTMDWFEALAENYLGIPGAGQSPLLQKLLKLRENYPIVLHSISLNIGSTDPLDYEFLKKLKELKNITQPKWISDHLCWTGVSNKNSHELLPLPYNKEAIDTVVNHIVEIQDYFGERFMIENTSSYITYKNSEMTEWEFISEIVKKTDCGLLLDVNNIYVSAKNHAFDAQTFLDNIPLQNVGQIHIAGHEVKENGLIVDTHDSEVCDDVYELLKYLNNKMYLPSVMAEWDDNIPDLQTYEKQVNNVKKIVKTKSQ